jgi:aminotransferase in exopolysaccharide biosynthesis
MFEDVVDFIKKIYGTDGPIPLHAPVFTGNEKRYLMDCIDTTYVSSVGQYVSRFEDVVRDYVGARYAVAVVNGTCALHMALLLLGVKSDDEVLIPVLTFVATANAVSHCGARPVLVDCERETLGMSVDKLEEFLQANAFIDDDGFCCNSQTGRRIAACLPVHIFGHPARVDLIVDICEEFRIPVLEDAAESLGSRYKGRHTGTFGKVGVLSFNGNKIVTTGGGGMIVTDDLPLAQRARHISTTARITHQWEFIHDEVGFNYRMTNVNAAVGCGQMENIDFFIRDKRELAQRYQEFFGRRGIECLAEPPDCFSNYWLNAIILQDEDERDRFLEFTNRQGIMTRPVWRLMTRLVMYEDCQSTNLDTAQWLEKRVVNIPSGVMKKIGR